MSLSDKKIVGDEILDFEGFNKKDVKEAIKELKDKLHHHGNGGITVKTRFKIYADIDEIFGKELTE